MIEKKVKNVTLEKPFTIVIGKKKYSVKSPSLATMMELSALIPRIPNIDIKTENPFLEVLKKAKDGYVLPEMLASLILGAKKKADIFYKIRLKILIERIRHISPKQYNRAISTILESMNVADFFGITTSLNAVNLLKPTTAEVVKNNQKKKMTASGQQSQDL